MVNEEIGGTASSQVCVYPLENVYVNRTLIPCIGAWGDGGRGDRRHIQVRICAAYMWNAKVVIMHLGSVCQQNIGTFRSAFVPCIRGERKHLEVRVDVTVTNLNLVEGEDGPEPRLVPAASSLELFAHLMRRVAWVLGSRTFRLF